VRRDQHAWLEPVERVEIAFLEPGRVVRVAARDVEECDVGAVHEAVQVVDLREVAVPLVVGPPGVVAGVEEHDAVHLHEEPDARVVGGYGPDLHAVHPRGLAGSDERVLRVLVAGAAVLRELLRAEPEDVGEVRDRALPLVDLLVEVVGVLVGGEHGHVLVANLLGHDAAVEQTGLGPEVAALPVVEDKEVLLRLHGHARVAEVPDRGLTILELAVEERGPA